MVGTEKIEMMVEEEEEESRKLWYTIHRFVRKQRKTLIMVYEMEYLSVIPNIKMIKRQRAYVSRQ